MRIAIVCSWLNQYGGAERVLEILHNLYPNAPIYTSMYEPSAMPAQYRTWDIRTSFLQRMPFTRRHHQAFLPLYPYAFEQFDLGAYDTVISMTSAFAHGVITKPDTHHLCYCLTPARFLWNYGDYVRRERIGGLLRGVLAPTLTWLRLWDVSAAKRVDRFVGISNAVANRIAKCYRREASVIYPPVDVGSYHVAPDHDDFYLVVSRLIPYKRIDLAVEACSRLNLPLKIVGAGRDRAFLEKIAGPTIQFLGRLDDSAVKQLYTRCKAFIFPGEEDFGLTPLEAQASGRPVIAYGAGGALETIVDGETGVFFSEPSADTLVDAIQSFHESDYDPAAIRRHAMRFDIHAFKHEFAQLVDESYAEHNRRATILRG